MFRGLSRAFTKVSSSGLVKVPNRSLFNLRGIYNTIKGEFAHGAEAGPGRYNFHSMESSETQLFDEDAHEVTAMVTQNPFDLEIFMGDTNPQKNFGTVDNPVLLFSANVGWRYVMCTGMNDEDEGLSHTGVWFILRDGPIHRCSHCGQCFKLVNLKDEISEENDYYIHHYMPILEEEMGDRDELVTRWTFHKFAEEYPSSFPLQNTLQGFILVNADEHDRILTDPAYRIQKLHEGHQTLSHLHQALIEIEQRLLWERGGFTPFKSTRSEYEDHITAELAIRKLDRIFDKIKRFQKRAVMEPEDHERREARMLERAAKRKDSFTMSIHTTETELRFKDYYESDYDSEEELMAELDEEQQLIVSGIFSFKNYDFCEEGTDGSTQVVEGVFEKKMFRFKHRKWNDDPASHFIRENRMINRFLERIKRRDPQIDFDGDKAEMYVEDSNNQFKLKNYVLDEAVQQYKDYYESDAEDVKDFEYITPEEKEQFAVLFKDYAKPLGESKKSFSVGLRQYDSEKSLAQNLVEHYRDLKTRVLPEIREQVKAHSIESNRLTDSRTVDLAPSILEFEAVDGLENIFVEHLSETAEIANAPNGNLHTLKDAEFLKQFK